MENLQEVSNQNAKKTFNEFKQLKQDKLIKSFDRIPAKTESQTTNNLETQQSTNSKKTGPKTGPKSMENLQEVSNQNAKKMFNEFKQLKQNIGGKRKSKKTKKVRKHRGITQTGGSAGKLRKGYKYTGRRLKNGKPEIKKVKQTRK